MNPFSKSQVPLVPIVLIFSNFVYYPIWLVGPSSFVAGLRFGLFFTSCYLLTYIGYKVKIKSDNDSMSINSNVFFFRNISYEKSTILIFCFLSSFIYFYEYLTIPLTSGGDEAVHVKQSLQYYDIITLGLGNAILIRLIALLLMIIIYVLFILSIVNISYLDQIIPDTSTTRQNLLILSIIFVLIFLLSFIFGFIVFYYLSSNEIIIHPYLPSTMIRFPPLKAILGTIFLLIFGIHAFIFRLLSIIFTSLALWSTCILLLRLMREENVVINSFHKITVVIFVISMTLLILMNPVIVRFAPIFYQTSGEMFFFIISITYLLKYIQEKDNQNHKIYTTLVIAGFLYRRTLIFLIGVGFITFLIINRNELLNIQKALKSKSNLNYNLLYAIWIALLPIIVIILWFVNELTLPYPEEEAQSINPGFDLSRLSLNFSAKFTIYDYYIMTPRVVGWFIVLLALIYIVYASINKSHQKVVALILFIIVMWYFGISLQQNWHSRVARFIAPLLLIWYLFALMGIVVITKGINDRIHLKRKNYIINVVPILIIISLILVTNVEMKKDRQIAIDANTRDNVYPFDQLAAFFAENFVSVKVYSPWKGVNPYRLYEKQFELTQTMSEPLWIPIEQQNLSLLYNFMKENEFQIIVLPQPSSQFLNINQELYISLINSIVTFQKIIEFNYFSNYLYGWQIL